MCIGICVYMYICVYTCNVIYCIYTPAAAAGPPSPPSPPRAGAAPPPAPATTATS